MAESENLNTVTKVLQPEPDLAYASGKTAADSKKTAMYKVVIPLAVIFVCTIIVIFMLHSAMKNAARVEGKFTLSQSGGATYIDVDSDGKYILCSNGAQSSGVLVMNGSELTFESSSGKALEARLVERKYIVFENAEFLKGEIPGDAAFFDAEVVSDEGVAYGFRSNGSFYVAEEGRNTDLGSYITDGYFIIVTTDGVTTTYLNCGDGITSAFYQAS